MNKNLDHIAEEISKNLISISQTKSSNARWKTILPVEQLVTGYGKAIEAESTEIKFQTIDAFTIPEGDSFSSDQYHQRLYTSPFKSQTTADFVSIAGFASGQFNVRIIAENEDNSRVLRSVDFNTAGENLALPPIATSELLSGDSLVLEINAKSITHVSNLAWIATRRNHKLNNGIRIVLIRTFGNKNIVQENLERVTDYLSAKGTSLDNYLFIVYDATAAHDPLQLESGINALYIKGGNYGGGGNASLLIALLQKAHQLCPDVSIDEVMLWDDDAVLEPQIFIRHDGFTAFRKEDVAHTGIVFSKTSPRRIQEYGGIWGAFFDLDTGQLVATNEKQRQPYPYLVRNNRDITKEWDRKYIGSQQEIEFGTFIYISIPYASLKKTDGSIPFFLRNDDVELGLRLKAAGATISVNQNMFAWHEATHNIIGEFYATLHGMIVNSTYCDLDKAWLIKNLMVRVTGASSVGNTALLEAYKFAIQLFLEGPAWMHQADVFEKYLAVSKAIGDRLKSYYQIPYEVIDTLKKQNKLEVHSLTNSMVRRTNTYAAVALYDAPNKRYLRPSRKEQETERELIAELAELIGILSSQFDAKKIAWADFIRNFKAIPYWENFFRQSLDALSLGEIVAQPYKVSSLSVTESSWIRTVRAGGQPVAPVPGLPEDFNNNNYLKLNPDVEAAGIDAAAHYLQFGIHEGRRFR